MPTKPLDERTSAQIHEMHEAFEGGATLRELGDVYGISYERVRQLFVDAGLPTERPKRQTVGRYASEVSAWEQKDKIWALYQRFGTVEDVAYRTGIPRTYISRIVGEMPLRQIYRRKGESHSYERSQIIEALREAAKVCGEPLTIPAYRSEASKRGWPADLTVIRAFDVNGDSGTWEKACEAAGVKANPSEGPRKGSITAQECIGALRESREALGHVPSYEQYVKWARENKKPSGPTVRVKVGPWRKALKQAFEDESV